MEEENTGPFRRTSSRTKKIAAKMAAALSSTDNRMQVGFFAAPSVISSFLLVLNLSYGLIPSAKDVNIFCLLF